MENKKTEQENKLAAARKTINEVDAALAKLFVQRMDAVADVIAYKMEHGLPVLDPVREKEVLVRCGDAIDSDAYRPYFVSFMESVMEQSKRYQRSVLFDGTVGYQGTEGAYAQIALSKLFPSHRAQAFETWQDVFEAVMRDEIGCGVIPFENSYTGEVEEVLDLLYRYPVSIREIYDLKIEHCLVAPQGASIGTIQEVVSHPQALKQCGGYIKSHGFHATAYVNTALAAEHVAKEADLHKAAIASKETAERFGLSVLAEKISESAQNTTRFIVIAKQPANAGNHFSLLFTLRHDAGQLAAVMQIIAQHGFNMECVRSKAVHDVPWQYYFHVELEGDASSEQAKQLFCEMQVRCTTFRVLGVYYKS